MADTTDENKTPAEQAKEKAEGTSASNNSNDWAKQLTDGLSAGLDLFIRGWDYFSGNKDTRDDKTRTAQLELATQQQQTTKTLITTIAVIGAVLGLILIIKK